MSGDAHTSIYSETLLNIFTFAFQNKQTNKTHRVFLQTRSAHVLPRCVSFFAIPYSLFLDSRYTYFRIAINLLPCLMAARLVSPFRYVCALRLSKHNQERGHVRSSKGREVKRGYRAGSLVLSGGLRPVAVCPVGVGV